MTRLLPWLLTAALMMPAAGVAREFIGVRVGDHAAHGRIVFDWPQPPPYRLEQHGTRVLLRFGAPAELDLAGVRRPVRNVTGVAAVAEGVEITVRPGVRARHFRHGPWVVVDLLDPAPEAPPAPPPRAEDAQDAQGTARSGTAAQPVPPPAPPAPDVPATPAVADAVRPPESGLGAAALNAASVSLPPPSALPVRLIGAPGQPRAALLPFGAEVGLALLRRGDLVLAVFDKAQPLDLSALRRDPVLGAMTAEILPGGTQIALRLDPPATLRARRLDGAWALEAAHPGAAGEASPDGALAIGIEGSGQLLLRASHPGRVVALSDPLTGLPLLLGTMREPAGHVPQPRRLPEADLPSTLLGAAVLARSDHVTLRAAPDGFLLGAAGGGALSIDPAVATGVPQPPMTRLFDIPDLPVPVLVKRQRAEQAAIAAAPPLARLALRRAAAETLLALGLPQEAQAVLALARLENPAAAEDSGIAALSGAAAALAGRPAEAEGLMHPDLEDCDELILWRAVLAAIRGEAGAAAPGFTATLPLVLEYPEGVRARLLPLVAHTLMEKGEREALARLVAAAPGRADLALARAALAEAEGHTEEALAAYDALTRGRDRLVRVRALRRGIELRLATGRMDPAQAAQALEAALVAWRGDQEEFATRLRLARLRLQAGEARGALALLQETGALFPEQASGLRPKLQEAFLAALESEPPLGAVAVFDAHPDLLPAGLEGEAAVMLLADRMIALDLTDRAAALLRRAVEGASGAQRAALGLRLARLRLTAGEAAQALAVLEQTASPALPEALAQERAVLRARAQALRGDMAQAMASLRALGPPGAEPLAELLAERQDWAGAAAVLQEHLRDVLPPSPAALEMSHRRVLLRQAALLALAGRAGDLAALGAEFGPRMRNGPLAEPFAALTADPLRGLADLPRLQRELQLFRALPAGLEPLRAASLGTR
ncbi:hypothetical protein [Crenalkalicoccus roseus]|uniref:hypothetical protein n=1 Tax=Crenalkalicoccus roseus TaxID=1485588 RepID=UPI001081125A|nr:hypothetical protein [Crenalkalicoccus roseus]